MHAVGWREWAALPELGLSRIKCKVDTGARTSALHAFAVEPFTHQGELWVRFGMHPEQHNQQLEHWCQAKVMDQRSVTDSGGHQAERYFITTQLRLGSLRYDIDLSLTNRDSMKFRMLLGRQALKQHTLVVDSAASYLQPWQETQV